MVQNFHSEFVSAMCYVTIKARSLEAQVPSYLAQNQYLRIFLRVSIVVYEVR